MDGLLQIRDPVAKTGHDVLLLVELTATRLAILHENGNGLILLGGDGVLVVGVGAGIVQLLLTVIHHEAEVVQLNLQLVVVWGL